MIIIRSQLTVCPVFLSTMDADVTVRRIVGISRGDFGYSALQGNLPSEQALAAGTTLVPDPPVARGGGD